METSPIMMANLMKNIEEKEFYLTDDKQSFSYNNWIIIDDPIEFMRKSRTKQI